jgi:FkbM family methyltransferase
MKLAQRIRLHHRAWRYRLRTERDEIRFVLQAIGPGEVAVDIGAHKAAFTYWMARRVGVGGRVLAIEPQPELVDYLQQAARCLAGGQVDVLPIALSDRDGVAQLHFCGDHLGAASVEIQQGPSIDVPMRTLDEVIREHQLDAPVSFIKCDVESHELAVFRGARHTLTTDRPVLLFESGHPETGLDRLLPVADFLNGLGFEGYAFHGARLIPIAEIGNTHFAPDGQWNFVFLHPAAVRIERLESPFGLTRK